MTVGVRPDGDQDDKRTKLNHKGIRRARASYEPNCTGCDKVTYARVALLFRAPIARDQPWTAR